MGLLFTLHAPHGGLLDMPLWKWLFYIPPVRASPSTSSMLAFIKATTYLLRSWYCCWNDVSQLWLTQSSLSGCHSPLPSGFPLSLFIIFFSIYTQHFWWVLNFQILEGTLTQLNCVPGNKSQPKCILPASWKWSPKEKPPYGMLVI